jgi:hypothetical protein
VDTQRPQINAAVRPAATARQTGSAVEIRFDGAVIAYFQTMIAAGITKRDHFNRQLMAQDAGISEKGLFTFECVQVGSADADAQNTHQCFILPWLGWQVNVGEAEMFRLIENNGFHIDTQFGGRKSIFKCSAFFNFIQKMQKALFADQGVC